MIRVLWIVWGADMRFRHNGPSELAKKAGFPIRELGEGKAVAFVNGGRDKLVILAGLNEANTHGVLGYYKSPKGKLTPNSIGALVRAFGGRGARYSREARNEHEGHKI